MKLHDYKCTGCGSMTEKMSDEERMPCVQPGCAEGWAVRQLGGRPMRAPAPNMGGYTKESRFSPIGPPIRVPGCAHNPPLRVQVGLLEQRQVPKARA